LDERDKELKDATRELQNETTVSGKKSTTAVHSLSANLSEMIEMNRDLASTRSTMHYLGESANFLANKINTFEDYVKARLDDWEENPPVYRQETLQKVGVQLPPAGQLQKEDQRQRQIDDGLQEYVPA